MTSPSLSQISQNAFHGNTPVLSRPVFFCVGACQDFPVDRLAVLAVYENRRKYTPGTNFRAWMFRILLNKCFVANRETKRLPEPLDRAENKSVAAAEPTENWDVLNDPMKILDACGDEVYQAFGKLSMAQRTCIMLKGVERFTYQEIADTLEIPVGTVMTHLSRGRAKLRKLLADYAMKMKIIPAAAER